jgi:hypothetical protein
MNEAQDNDIEHGIGPRITDDGNLRDVLLAMESSDPDIRFDPFLVQQQQALAMYRAMRDVDRSHRINFDSPAQTGSTDVYSTPNDNDLSSPSTEEAVTTDVNIRTSRRAQKSSEKIPAEDRKDSTPARQRKREIEEYRDRLKQESSSYILPTKPKSTRTAGGSRQIPEAILTTAALLEGSIELEFVPQEAQHQQTDFGPDDSLFLDDIIYEVPGESAFQAHSKQHEDEEDRKKKKKKKHHHHRNKEEKDKSSKKKKHKKHHKSSDGKSGGEQLGESLASLQESDYSMSSSRLHSSMGSSALLHSSMGSSSFLHDSSRTSNRMLGLDDSHASLHEDAEKTWHIDEQSFDQDGKPLSVASLAGGTVASAQTAQMSGSSRHKKRELTNMKVLGNSQPLLGKELDSFSQTSKSNRSLPIDVLVAANSDLLVPDREPSYRHKAAVTSSPLVSETQYVDGAEENWATFYPADSSSEGVSVEMLLASAGRQNSDKRRDLYKSESIREMDYFAGPGAHMVRETPSGSEAKGGIGFAENVSSSFSKRKEYDKKGKKKGSNRGDFELSDDVYWVATNNDLSSDRKSKRARIVIASLITLVTLGGVVAAIYFGFFDSKGNQTATLDPCDVSDLARQCQVNGNISVPSCYDERYHELRSSVVAEIYPAFDEDASSCSIVNLAIISLSAASSGSESSQELESAFLLDILYHGTNGQDWFRNEGWTLSGPSCSWFGVVCDRGGVVTGISLASNNLKGSLPSEIGSFTKLEQIALAGNEIGGTLPSHMHQLSVLQTLDLKGNKIMGQLPSEIGLMSSLEVLDGSFNRFDQTVPSSFGALSKLSFLYLNNNMIGGSIPSEIGACSDLRVLQLNSNEISGKLPTELGSLERIEVIQLDNNFFSQTTIPSELGRLSNLQVLVMDGSNVIGTLPSEIGNLKSLETLQLGSLALSGSIPTEIGMLTSLQTLNLNLNRLDGTLPSEIGLLAALTKLDVSYNRFEGNLPSELGQLTNVETLLVLGNFIVGTVPLEICALWDAKLKLFLGDFCSETFLTCPDTSCCQGC